MVVQIPLTPPTERKCQHGVELGRHKHDCGLLIFLDLCHVGSLVVNPLMAFMGPIVVFAAVLALVLVDSVARPAVGFAPVLDGLPPPSSATSTPAPGSSPLAQARVGVVAADL